MHNTYTIKIKIQILDICRITDIMLYNNKLIQ